MLSPRNRLQPCYAGAKDLPVEFLERLGLSSVTYSGSSAVRIPYRGRDGAETAVHFRLALAKDPEADNRFRWRKGSQLALYGLWRLDQTEKAGHTFLVEGESDCHTLWHHGLPAPGVPGASKLPWAGRRRKALSPTMLRATPTRPGWRRRSVPPSTSWRPSSVPQLARGSRHYGSCGV